MPDLSEEVRKDIETRLSRYLQSRNGYGEPIYVSSGGSAAIFKVTAPDGPIAIKVYDPRFFADANAKAEKRRLELQRSLIGHDCPTLVRVMDVTEAHGTGFIEMEFVAWPQLKKELQQVPDDAIPGLINQLVAAVAFLEKRDVVHRDIKPENIHVSPDFKSLKLIDLGVARLLSIPEEEGDDGTDHGRKRPFIATAQYSSPEYLFRLDAPSEELWRALNLYQLGAVLHDLINKRQLFDHEVGLDNKWLVARAVLSKTPTYPDSDPTRLIHLKALAARCLVKDMETRLRIASLSDFAAEAPADLVAALKAKLNKAKGFASANVAATQLDRLRFERTEFVRSFCNNLRNELIPALDGEVALTLTARDGDSYQFEFAVSQTAVLVSRVDFEWLGETQPTTAEVSLTGQIAISKGPLGACPAHKVAAVTIGASPEVGQHDVSGRLAVMIGTLLDMLSATPDSTVLHGADVATICFAGEANGY